MSHVAALDVSHRLTPQDLCHDHVAAVCRFSAMLATSPGEAEDIAQEALLKAVRKLDQYEPSRGPLEPWLWRIVVHSAQDSRRRDSRRLALWDRLTQLRHEPTSTVEARALDNITNQELLAAVRSLGRRDRMLLGLRYGADLDLAAVGQAVGLSQAAAGRAVLRAISKVRKRLGVKDE
jgi:RNA polymerase sigma-70 factor, ECF subfamily